MMKSLFAGAAALSLIATAAVAQEAYDSTSRTTTTVTQPVVTAPPAESSTTTVQRTYDPYYGTVEHSRTTTTSTAPGETVNESAYAAPPTVTYTPPTSTYHEEKTVSQDGQVVEKSSRSETASPYGRTSTWSQTTTNQGD